MKKNRSAFTLVELMVVLAIIALLSALIFGAFSSVREGNKRGSCQSNLNQIYAALRLYAQDNDGQFPYRNGGVADDTGSTPNKTPNGGSGLWSLYVYAPKTASGDAYGLPLSSNDSQQPGGSDPRGPATLASYLKSPRAFHCPSDNFNESVTYATAGGTDSKIVSSGQIEFKGSDLRQHLNPNYLSYQQNDDVPSNEATYSTFRLKDAKRQLRSFKQDTATTVSLSDQRSPDQTVVTWCRFHRSLKADGTTRTATSDFYRTNDNVLFLDGSVQSIPILQGVTTQNGSAATCHGWQRVPLAIQDSAPNSLSDSASPDFCS